VRARRRAHTVAVPADRSARYRPDADVLLAVALLLSFAGVASPRSGRVLAVLIVGVVVVLAVALRSRWPSPARHVASPLAAAGCLLVSEALLLWAFWPQA
jgi:hypothetical protein